MRTITARRGLPAAAALAVLLSLPAAAAAATPTPDPATRVTVDSCAADSAQGRVVNDAGAARDYRIEVMYTDDQGTVLASDQVSLVVDAGATEPWWSAVTGADGAVDCVIGQVAAEEAVAGDHADSGWGTGRTTAVAGSALLLLVGAGGAVRSGARLRKDARHD